MKTSALIELALLPFRVVWLVLKPLIALLMPLACMAVVANLLTLPWIGICHCLFPDYPTWTKVVMVVLGTTGFLLGMELSFKIARSDLFEKYIYNS